MKRSTVKRIVISAVLVLALSLAAALGITASLTATTEIYAENVVVTPGSTSVTVPVKYRNNNVTAEAGLIKIGYNSSLLTYVSAADSTSAESFNAAAENGIVSVAFAGASVSASEGTLFTVRFTVPSNYEASETITVTVENFGSTTGLNVTEYAGDVTATNGRVSTDLTNLTSDGTDMPSKIALALIAAANDDATIDLGGNTWTFTGNTVFGDSESIPDHTITIKNGTIKTDGYISSFRGHFKFSNVEFVGAANANNNNDAVYKNGLYFPEGASCIIDTGCTGSNTKSQRVNIIGDDLTVRSGSYCVIAAQIYANPNVVNIDNPKITIEGNTVVAIACGLGHNVKTVTGEADIKVKGTPTIEEYLIAGGWNNDSNALGGKLEVKTEGDCSIRAITAVMHGNGLGNKASAPTYELDIEPVSGTLTVQYGISSLIVNGGNTTAWINTNITVGNGVSITDTNPQYFGFKPGYTGLYVWSASGGGNIDVTINGGTFAGLVYGGSIANKNGDVVPNVVSNIEQNINVTINGGTFNNGFAGGSYLSGAGAKVAGTINVTTTGLTMNGTKDFLGGSYVSASGAVADTSGTLTINGGNFYRVFGGSYVNGAGKQINDTRNVYIYKLDSLTNNIYGAGCITNKDGEIKGTFTTYFGSSQKALIDTARSFYGGAYLDAGKITGNTKLVVDNVKCSSDVYGGSQFRNIDLKHTGDSELEVVSGTLSRLVSGGCQGRGNMTIDNVSTPVIDTDSNGLEDKIYGGFAHEGNVTVTIKGGTLSGRKSFAGYGLNVSGNVTVNILGGTFSGADVHMLSDSYVASNNWWNATGVLGDLKVYIKDGNFTGINNIKVAREYSLSIRRPADGVGLVAGKAYWEISGGQFGANTKLYANGGAVAKDVYVKFVGSSFTLANASLFIPSNAVTGTNSAGTSNSKYLDLSLVPADSTAYTYFTTEGQYFNNKGNWNGFTVFPSLGDIDTLEITSPVAYADAVNGTLGEAALKATFSKTVYYNTNKSANEYLRSNSDGSAYYAYDNAKAITYADLIAWDEYASKEEYKTANAFVFNNTVSKLTASLDVTVAGKDFDFPIDNPGVEEAETFTGSNFGFLGLSIRTYDKAFRARGYVTETLRNATIANNGFEVKSYGVLISKSVTAPLTLGAGSVKAAVAYEAGTSTDKYYLENGKFAFAAAIQNIPEANYGTGIYFRPYVELVDAAGVTYVVYPDYSTVQNFKADNGMNSYASLRDVAAYHKNHETAYYTANKKVIDAIVG